MGGTVTITGGMSDADCSGGNGIRWFVDFNRRNLDTGTFDNCGRSTFKAGLTVKVRPGNSLYFIVDANGDPFLRYRSSEVVRLPMFSVRIVVVCEG